MQKTCKKHAKKQLKKGISFEYVNILQNITSPVWSLSIKSFGAVVQGITAIRQRIDIALTTSKGTDPLRPEFGTLIYTYQDAPISVAAVEIKKEIIKALQIWVPDITNIKVTYTIINAQVIFNIGYALVDIDLIDDIQYELDNGVLTGKSNQLVLQSFFPVNTTNQPYQVALSLNNVVVNPAPPSIGFDTIELLYDWILYNWKFLGKWLLQPDQLIGQISDPKYLTGSLVISVLNLFKVWSSIPVLNPGQKWVVQFQPDPTATNYLADNPFYTLSDLVTGMQAQFGDYGSWNLESNTGDFNSDFNGDFNISNTKLVLITRNNPLAVITITVA